MRKQILKLNDSITATIGAVKFWKLNNDVSLGKAMEAILIAELKLVSALYLRVLTLLRAHQGGLCGEFQNGLRVLVCQNSSKIDKNGR